MASHDTSECFSEDNGSQSTTFILIKKKNMRIIKIIICALCHHIFFILKILAPSILIKLLEMRKKKVSNYFNYIIEILFLILYKFRGGKKQKNEGLM